MSVDELEKLANLKERGILTEEEFQSKKAEILGSSYNDKSSVKAVEIWNPSAAANWSLLFSPVFGAFLQAQNWKVLGEQKKHESSMLWVYSGGLILLLVVIVPSIQQYGGGIGFLWLLIWYFTASKKQAAYIKEKYDDNYPKKGWFKPVLVAIGIIFALIIVVSVIESKGSRLGDPTVAVVKDGNLYTCPNHTVEEMVNSFMGSPSWESGTSKNGDEFVNINGDIMYSNKEVRATVQFIINKDETFKFSAIEMNGVPQNKLIANALMKKMCESVSK